MGSKILVLFVATLVGCGDSDPPAKPDGHTKADASAELELTYYADAKPIFDAKCKACHSEGGIGPMPLTSYGEVTLFTSLIEGEVRAGVMPPWRANTPFGFFEGDRRLTDEQKATLLNWIEQGAAEGDPEDEPEGLPEPTKRELARIDMTLPIPEPYAPQIEPDDYRCFVLEWPYEQSQFVTGINIAPSAPAIVHHAILYHVQPENAAAARERDAAEEGPGYTCFAATGGVAAWLQSYEPGGYGQDIPGNIGFEIRPGSVMILQVHYNTSNGRDTDQSAVEFTIEDSVEHPGQVMLILQPSWQTGGMPIPADESDVPFAAAGRPVSRSYGIYWADLHMHQLGSHGRIGIIRAGRPDVLEVLLDIPSWDFAWQETYVLKKPETLNTGDRLYVECHFDNSAENQAVVNGEQLTPRDVNWGEGTTDEMCLGNVLATPL